MCPHKFDQGAVAEHQTARGHESCAGLEGPNDGKFAVFQFSHHPGLGGPHFGTRLYIDQRGVFLDQLGDPSVELLVPKGPIPGIDSQQEDEKKLSRLRVAVLFGRQVEGNDCLDPLDGGGVVEPVARKASRGAHELIVRRQQGEVEVEAGLDQQGIGFQGGQEAQLQEEQQNGKADADNGSQGSLLVFDQVEPTEQVTGLHRGALLEADRRFH